MRRLAAGEPGSTANLTINSPEAYAGRTIGKGTPASAQPEALPLRAQPPQGQSARRHLEPRLPPARLGASIDTGVTGVTPVRASAQAGGGSRFAGEDFGFPGDAWPSGTRGTIPPSDPSLPESVPLQPDPRLPASAHSWAGRAGASNGGVSAFKAASASNSSTASDWEGSSCWLPQSPEGSPPHPSPVQHDSLAAPGGGGGEKFTGVPHLQAYLQARACVQRSLGGLPPAVRAESPALSAFRASSSSSFSVASLPLDQGMCESLCYRARLSVGLVCRPELLGPF